MTLKRMIYAALPAMLAVTLTGRCLAADDAHAEHAHQEHKHHTALFLGGTSSSGGKHGATVGAEYEYRLHDKMGLTGLIDYAGGEIDTTIVAGGRLFHPGWDFRLMLAPGVDFHGGHEDFVLRIGGVYDFHLGNWSVSPTIHFDLLEAKENVVYGLGIGYGF